tara:strand:+ start:462 stop:1073 length:612 start_codon:yes stop_codon:yes gene_type:complete
MNLDIKLHKHDLPDQLKLGNKIAVDCEMGGLNFKRDPLFIVQISTGNLDAHIIQLNRRTYKAPNLINVLKNKEVKKIFHFARADLGFIYQYLNIDVENVDCTKIKSKLSRTYTDRHSLKDLIKEFTGVEISKQQQSSDFGGDLTTAQLKYCANDVIYLHKINDQLDKMLIRENRMQLYDETIKFIKTRVNLDIASFKDDIWSH